MTDQEVNGYLALNLMFKIGKGCRKVVRPMKPFIIEGFHGRADCEKYIKSVCPDYCNNISQSLGDGAEGTVVGEMEKLGWECDWDNEDKIEGISPGFTAEFIGRRGVFKTYSASANTPSRAICLAAVEALKNV